MALAGLLALPGCAEPAGSSKPSQSGDAAIATVNNQTVWLSDVRREAVAQGVIGENERLDPSSELFRRMLDEVVDQRLLAAEAVRRGVQKDPGVRRRLEADRDRILGDVLVQTIVEQAVNEGAIRGLYEEQRRLAKPADQFHARQIVVASQAEADAIRKLLSSGGVFEALATRRSLDAATRFNGGDLGYFTADTMPDAYQAALKTAKTGDVLGPIQADAGWVLLKIEDRRPEPPMSLEAARPQIVRFLTYDQVRDLLQQLRSKAKVQILAAQAQPPSAAPRGQAASPNPPTRTSP
ncbi:MAG TPA: peptidyl-prolyl cis-trans isomerase [Caulobacteraceae bacterium]|jgi:peptidyl-prolyl cis-trans isomerase C|nr:peptidyl-prolyl cis-trans isomerase [Caulobacteraceae bacterium]